MTDDIDRTTLELDEDIAWPKNDPVPTDSPMTDDDIPAPPTEEEEEN